MGSEEERPPKGMGFLEVSQERLVCKYCGWSTRRQRMLVEHIRWRHGKRA